MNFCSDTISLAALPIWRPFLGEGLWPLNEILTFDHLSHGRVLSALAVARARGDRDFKLHAGAEPGTPFHASLVVADPDVRVARVQPGDMLLLACDGLWDVFTPEGAFAYLEAKGASAQPQRAVQQLCKAAEEEYGSLDNITAVLVQI